MEAAIGMEKNSIGMLTIPETFVADIIIREIKGMLARIPRYLKRRIGFIESGRTIESLSKQIERNDVRSVPRIKRNDTGFHWISA